MDPLTREQITRRERTLLAALLLSMWAPLATGVAVVLSHSTTQLADFIRRSIELIALLTSWLVFRRVRSPDLSSEVKARMERFAGLCVAAALGCSGFVMLGLALSRVNSFQPGGNVYPGLTIAGLGLVTNVWFWRRYCNLTREKPNPIIDVQSHLYRGKSLVDLCVIVALTAVAIHPTHPATRYIDIMGTVAVAAYLLRCAARSIRGLSSEQSRLTKVSTD